jgi:hypothetical protein
MDRDPMVGQAFKAVAHLFTKLEDKSEAKCSHLGTLPGPQTFSFYYLIKGLSDKISKYVSFIL